jgi:imidazolonepropionase-like amidohydrolase
MEVTLRTGLLGTPEASAELLVGRDVAQIVVEAINEGEGFEEVLAKIRRMLAHLGMVGKFYVDTNIPFDDEARGEAQRVIDNLSERDRTITPADVQRVLQEDEERAKQVSEGLKHIARIMKEEGLRRGLNKEERKKLSLDEVFGLEQD